MSNIIIGAGLAGLGAADVLQSANVYEEKSYCGGHAYSHYQDGHYWDEGAHICHSSDADYLNKLNQSNIIETKTSRVNNLYYGKRIGYPVQNNLRDLSPEEKLEALKGLFEAKKYQAHQVRNYEDWLRFNYGDFLTDKFYALFTKKYWNCEMSELGLDWLGGRLISVDVRKILEGAFNHKEITSQAVFKSFKYTKTNGYFGLFNHAFQNIPIQLNHKVSIIDLDNQQIYFENGCSESYESLLSSIPLKDLVKIIKDMPEDIRKACEDLRATQAVYVNLVLKRKCMDEHWMYVYDHDVIFSRIYSQTNLSALSKFEGFQIQLECYFNQDNTVNIENIVERSQKDFMRIFDVAYSEIVSINYIYKKYAYVISNLNTESQAMRILNWLESKNYYGIGLYGRWKYIWSDAAYNSGREAAKKVLLNRSKL